VKRRNVQLAFMGEGTVQDDREVESLVEGDEAVEIAVVSGSLTVVVPAGTPDEQIFDAATTLGGELVLENGATLGFEINDEATGAQFSSTAAGSRRTDPHEGLSSIPNVPSGA
jgi:hypothetical protein